MIKNIFISAWKFIFNEHPIPQFQTEEERLAPFVKIVEERERRIVAIVAATPSLTMNEEDSP